MIENEKKRLYSRRVLDIEHGTFTPSVFTTTGGMGKEVLMYYSRLAKLIAIRKGGQYAKTISCSGGSRGGAWGARPSLIFRPNGDQKGQNLVRTLEICVGLS